MTRKRTQSNLLKVCNVIILDKANARCPFSHPMVLCLPLEYHSLNLNCLSSAYPPPPWNTNSLKIDIGSFIAVAPGLKPDPGTMHKNKQLPLHDPAQTPLAKSTTLISTETEKYYLPIEGKKNHQIYTSTSMYEQDKMV